MHSFFDTIPEENTLFREFFSCYLNEFDFKFNYKVKNEFDGFTLNGVYEYIYSSLLSYSIRALIAELHEYKNKNLLKGKTSKERFISFEQIVAHNKFRKKFYENYPVLKLKSEKKIEQTSVYINEILENLKKDKIDIEKNFKIEIKDLLNIHLGKGDSHNGGKSVAILEFKTKKIVYKPHNLYGDVILGNIVNWMNKNKKLKCNLNSLNIINYDDYGWEEFVEYKECKNVQQVENYYYRSGCFLAIFYTLGTNDIHYENIIVNGENPYFIDLETLVCANKEKRIDSVLTTGFLPNKSKSALFDVDLSGLCGNKQVSSKLTSMSVVNFRTDEMIIEKNLVQIDSSNNIVMLNNKFVKIEEYVEHFIDGFKDTLEFIINNKDLYITLLNKEFDKHQKFRQVIRYTHVYAKFLVAASHPDYLRSEDKQLELFERLYNASNYKAEHERVSSEISTLLEWDIPYYYCYYDSKNLYSSEKLISKDYFKYTIKEYLIDKIKKLNINIMEFQIDIIRKSLFTAYSNHINNKKIEIVNLKKENNENIIIQIADSIYSKILQMKDNTVSFLINTVILEKNEFLISPINFNLYEGGGIIWLFACLGKVFNNKKYKDISKQLLESSNIIYKYYKEKEYLPKKISAFFGDGSLMYLYYNMSILYDDDEYYSKFNEISQVISEYDCDYLEKSKDSEDFDFISGIAGVIVLASKIYLNTNNIIMKKIINKYSKYFILYINDNLDNLNKVGLAHGLSGYALALIILYHVKKDNSFLDLAIKLIDKEKIIYSNEKNIINTSWSDGEAGMILVCNELLKIKMNTKILKEVTKLLKNTSTNGLYNMNSMSLYNGIYGNIQVIEKVINSMPELENIITMDKINQFEEKLINDLSDIKLGLEGDFILDTFMLGSSGIAYAKLKKINPKLPSVLMLDILS